MTDDRIQVALPDRATAGNDEPERAPLVTRGQASLARELLNAIWPIVALALLAPLVAEEREDGALAGLLALVVLPLALRERWPSAVLLVTSLGTIATAGGTGTPLVQILAVALASYTTGERIADRTRSALFVLFIAALITAGIVAQNAEPFEALLVSFVVLVPAWLLGDIVRSRRIDMTRRAEAQARAVAEREQELQTAADNERKRVARELHDIVAHTVSVMVVQAGAARQVVQSSPDQAEASLAAVEATGRQAMAELRGFVGALGDAEEPGGIAPQPGIGELSALLARVRDAGLPVKIEIDGEPRALSPTLEVAVYRIVQEALTNALRYAQQAPTLVHLTYEPAQLRVEVLDEGPGGPAETIGTGRGLTGMRERAVVIGGRLEAGPRLGGGFAVRAWLPIEPAPA